MSCMRVGRAGVEFGIELGSAEDAERDDVEPEEQGDACAEGAVDLRVVGKARDIPAEDECGNEPHGGGDDGSGQDALPGLLHWRSHVVDETDDADAADKGDTPADEESEDVDRGASEGCDVQGQPLGDEVAEDDEDTGDGEGQQRERNEEDGAETALPEGPAVGGEIVG